MKTFQQKNIKIYILSLLCMIIFITGDAQDLNGTFEGIIVDKQTESPLGFATVKLLDDELRMGCVSNENGQFIMEYIPVGRHDFEFSIIGYDSLIITEVLITSGANPNVNVKLEASSSDLGEMVVKAKNSKEAPLNRLALVSTRQLSVEEANRFAGGFDDPGRMVSAYAGVAGSLSDNAVSVRGNAPKGMVYRIEGVAIPNPNHLAEISGFGGGSYTALSARLLDNSDFLLSAYPAEYGNALAGVFDFSLRNGSSNSYKHSLQASAIGLDISSEGPLSKKNKSSYLINYRYSTFGLISGLLEKLTGEDISGFGFQDLNFKLDFPTENAGNFSLWGIGLLDELENFASFDSLGWEYLGDRETFRSDQYSGVLGLTHKIRIKEKGSLKSTLHSNVTRLNLSYGIYDEHFIDFFDEAEVLSTTKNLGLSSIFNYYFNQEYTLRAGLVITGMGFNYSFKNAPTLGAPLSTFNLDNGNSLLTQAFAQTSIRKNKWTINPGLHFMHFALNGNYSLEPRLSVAYDLSETQKFAFGYGLHSQIERLNLYLTQIPNSAGYKQSNKNLDFSKAHHLVLSYDLGLNDFTHLRLEPYFQYLFDIPVVENSYFSLINLTNEFFIDDNLVNEGTGVNYGLDLTLERFLHKGFYYLFSASLFQSKYEGGDGIVRNTRFNKNVLANVLVGKEWTIANRNLLGTSVRYSFDAGNYVIPILREESIANERNVYDYSKAYSQRSPAHNVLSLSLSYQINKSNRSSLISLNVQNVLANPSFDGYRYNFRTHEMDEINSLIIIPNLSYRVNF